jgi:hypothetical protein
MKKLITTLISLALITTTAHAGWFGSGTPDPQIITLQNQLAEQHGATSFWIIVAVVLGLFAFIAFIVGSILGSRTRRNAKQPDSSEQ